MDKTRKKIKILLIAPALPLIGGQAVQARRLLENFRSEETLEIAFQPSNPRFFGKLQDVKILRTILTTVKYLFDLVRKIPRCDVLHVFSASYFTFVYVSIPAILLAKIFGKKAILNYRSGEAEDFFSRWGSPLLPFVRMYDAVVAPSDYLVDVFKKFDVAAVSISNFIEREKYIYRKRKPLRPRFLSNRILEPLYNIDCILKAFRIIQQRFPEADLQIAHKGIERERLEKLVRELKLENVKFVGLIPNEKIGELYDSADIYLNSPNFDCMPGSLIECFASGLPVVSTNAGGIPYIVENEKTGLLVELDDHEALAEKAIFLLENEKFAGEMIKNAFDESGKYSWENVREKWLALYAELAEKKILENSSALTQT